MTSSPNVTSTAVALTLARLPPEVALACWTSTRKWQQGTRPDSELARRKVQAASTVKAALSKVVYLAPFEPGLTLHVHNSARATAAFNG